MKLVARSDVLQILYEELDSRKADFEVYEGEYERGELAEVSYLIEKIKARVIVRAETEEE